MLGSSYIHLVYSVQNEGVEGVIIHANDTDIISTLCTTVHQLC